jgi:hypothetical protein
VEGVSVSQMKTSQRPRHFTRTAVGVRVVRCRAGGRCGKRKLETEMSFCHGDNDLPTPQLVWPSGQEGWLEAGGVRRRACTHKQQHTPHTPCTLSVPTRPCPLCLSTHHSSALPKREHGSGDEAHPRLQRQSHHLHPPSLWMNEGGCVGCVCPFLCVVGSLFSPFF